MMRMFLMLLAHTGFVTHALDAGFTATGHIGGLPVYNWDPQSLTAQSSDLDWIMVAKETATADQVRSVCDDADECNAGGAPMEEGGFGFVSVRASVSELEAVVVKHAEDFEFLEPDMPIGVLSSVGMNKSPANASMIETAVRKHGSKKDAGEGVHIYNIDSGIRFSHSEFEGRAHPAVETWSGELVECDEDDESCAADDNGHGTHVAANAAGKTYGLAKKAELYAVQVLKGGVGRTSSILLGLEWVTKSAKKPALMSFAMGSTGFSKAMAVATQRAAKSGISIIGASGNSKKDACDSIPGGIKEVIVVGAVDSLEGEPKRAPWSNFGSCIDGWGPGVDIVSASHKSDDGTQIMSGSSMAVGFVTGKVALYLGENEGLSPSELEEKLKENSPKVDVGDVDGEGNSKQMFLLFSAKDKKQNDENDEAQENDDEGGKRRRRRRKGGKGGKAGKGGKGGQRRRRRTGDN
jgi:subtilisin family serine protease